jgi:hypothetical protein
MGRDVPGRNGNNNRICIANDNNLFVMGTFRPITRGSVEEGEEEEEDQLQLLHVNNRNIMEIKI